MQIGTGTDRSSRNRSRHAHAHMRTQRHRRRHRRLPHACNSRQRTHDARTFRTIRNARVHMHVSAAIWVGAHA
eukprot:4960082-Alexandrium_andersonii.AAC.1